MYCIMCGSDVHEAIARLHREHPNNQPLVCSNECAVNYAVASGMLICTTAEDPELAEQWVLIAETS